MANINVNALFREKTGNFGRATDQPDWQDKFLAALNRTVKQMRHHTNQSMLTEVSSTEGSLSLSDDHIACVSDGLDYWLVKLGATMKHTGTRNKPLGLTSLKRWFEEGLDDYASAQLNSGQDDDERNPLSQRDVNDG